MGGPNLWDDELFSHYIMLFSFSVQPSRSNDVIMGLYGGHTKYEVHSKMLKSF